jgi:hypothetical protein
MAYGRYGARGTAGDAREVHGWLSEMDARGVVGDIGLYNLILDRYISLKFVCP